MNISREIAPHLPYLRRFARALCGSQKSGDAYVVATLEALVADIDAFPSKMSAKVGLYHLFMRSWSSIALNVEDRPDDEISAAQRNVSLLTPRSRQAFLLKTVEGFSTEDVADILSVTPEEVEALIAQAGREIAERVATDVLIIEDEALIAQDIEFIARDLGHQVIGIARTHKEALELAKGHRPGLILADIQLADGSSGLNAVNELLQNFDCPVIFITAFPERLLTGERPEPAFLISKPYKVDTVKATISQALFFERKASRVA
ncbi:response regulator [Methylocystis sp. MJC1]|jgi:DNA-directed RNA polymerase specialized sigma24 family protein|uniref:response regulator n=1 Tax=Methylocystis sp. MJC1 TaxID=2654282 RepID=UPI0013EA4E6D|nr:response regulator [Methylocystis sp. MJC1]KAF2990020.1 putative transcriptional regulatory protein pdtaR [Methylocystis sp. MJC1]MBU6528776.1 response regulator [Methylocystis sp. MJC1]UZX11661.1 response regulator [Methylocystis sp. MJC1]